MKKNIAERKNAALAAKVQNADPADKPSGGNRKKGNKKGEAGADAPASAGDKGD